MKTGPHLHFKGNCREAFESYADTLGGRIVFAMKQLAEGGTITMPCQETFWAHRFGMCTDRFGIPWMVNCEKPLG